MTVHIIDGKTIAVVAVCAAAKSAIAQLWGNGIQFCLVVVLIGNNPASTVAMLMKNTVKLMRMIHRLDEG